MINVLRTFITVSLDRDKMKLVTAFARHLSQLSQPVMTDYELCVVLFHLWRAKRFHGENLETKDFSPNIKFIEQEIFGPLVEYGTLTPDYDFPKGRVFKIPCKSENPEDVVCSVDPFAYVSHLSAMSFHGLTNRLPKIIYISTPPLRDWIYSANGKMEKDCSGHLDEYFSYKLPKLIRIRYDTVRKNKVIRYFSIHHGAFKHIEGRMLRVSTIGRTFLDMLRESQYCGGMNHVISIFTQYGQQYSKLIIEEIDRHGKAIEKARAGYLLEDHCHIKDERIEAWATHARRGGSRKLDPSKEYSEVFSERWCLSLNAD